MRSVGLLAVVFVLGCGGGGNMGKTGTGGSKGTGGGTGAAGSSGAAGAAGGSAGGTAAGNGGGGPGGASGATAGAAGGNTGGARGGAAEIAGAPAGHGGTGNAAGSGGGGGAGNASGTGGIAIPTNCGLDSDCGHGLTCCSGGVCANAKNDIDNCGRCGLTCTGDHPFCELGTCTTPLCFDVTCAGGTFCCGNQCCPAGQLCCINAANQIGCTDPVAGSCPPLAMDVATPVGTPAGTATGTPDLCTFQIAATVSAVIPTVGLVDWSTDLAGLTGARIDFTLDHPRADQINTGSGGPIDISGTTHRALMLGLKPGRPYIYRITATAGGTTCVSQDQKLTTGAVAPPTILTRTSAHAAAQARGFIIATGGVPWSGSGSAPQKVYIIDADGDVVWSVDAPVQACRALMDWSGATMWMLESNPSGPSTGEMRRVGMDGTGAQSISALAKGHHDFAVLPGGAVAALVYTGDKSASSDVIEYSPDGTQKTVLRLDAHVYKMNGTALFHANALRYDATDDSYTVGDRDAQLLLKITRQGSVLWQIGQSCTGSLAPKCAVITTWGTVHGHQVLDDGDLLTFHNGDNTSMSPAIEYSLTEGTTTLATQQAWSYVGPSVSSQVLGDVQRLPNGNTLVTYSTAGVIQEVTPPGDLVQTITDGTFGYTSFRETLYGPPTTAAP
jgi:hypothetical protein